LKSAKCEKEKKTENPHVKLVLKAEKCMVHGGEEKEKTKKERKQTKRRHPPCSMKIWEPLIVRSKALSAPSSISRLLKGRSVQNTRTFMSDMMARVVALESVEPCSRLPPGGRL
jgi:hypothetical protein